MPFGPLLGIAGNGLASVARKLPDWGVKVRRRPYLAIF